MFKINSEFGECELCLTCNSCKVVEAYYWKNLREAWENAKSEWWMQYKIWPVNKEYCQYCNYIEE